MTPSRCGECCSLAVQTPSTSKLESSLVISMVNRKKPPGQKRSNKTLLSFTDSEFEEQLRLARQANLEFAIYCRNKVLRRGSAIAPDINRQVWGQLGGLIADFSAIKELLILAQEKNRRIPDQLLYLLENELIAISCLRDLVLGKEGGSDDS